MSLHLSWRFSLFLILSLLLFIVGFFAFLKLTILSIPFLFALALSFLFEPVLLFWESRGGDRRIGILLLFFLLSFFLLLLVLLLPGWVEDRFIFLRDRIPRFFRELEGDLSLLAKDLERRIPGFPSDELFKKLSGGMNWVGERLLLSLPALLMHLVTIVLLTPFFTFFILRDRRSLRRTLLSLVPNRSFEIVFQLIHRVEEATERYIRGVLLEAVLVGSIAFLILFAFGVPSSLLLGVAVAFCNLIPYFGTLAVSAGGTLYLMLIGVPVSQAILVVVAVGVAHLLDNLFIAPLVLGSVVKIHPLIVLLLLVLGEKLLGVLGLVVAVPTGAIVYIVFQESWGILKRYPLRKVEEIQNSV